MFNVGSLGLQYQDLLKVIRKHSSEFLPELCREVSPRLTSGKLEDLVTISYSRLGSNKRMSEEDVATNWSRYLQCVEGML